MYLLEVSATRSAAGHVAKQNKKHLCQSLLMFLKNFHYTTHNTPRQCENLSSPSILVLQRQNIGMSNHYILSFRKTSSLLVFSMLEANAIAIEDIQRIGRCEFFVMNIVGGCACQTTLANSFEKESNKFLHKLTRYVLQQEFVKIHRTCAWPLKPRGEIISSSQVLALQFPIVMLHLDTYLRYLYWL